MPLRGGFACDSRDPIHWIHAHHTRPGRDRLVEVQRAGSALRQSCDKVMMLLDGKLKLAGSFPVTAGYCLPPQRFTGRLKSRSTRKRSWRPSAGRTPTASPWTAAGIRSIRRRLKQRAIEREKRRQKRKVLTAEASGDKDKALPEQIRLQTLRQDYRRFSKAAGLKTQDERHEIAIFGHKEAARAEKAVRQHREMLDRFQARMLTAGYKTEGFDLYFGDEETLENMASAYERMQKLYPAEAEGVIIRWGYDRDTTTYGWYDRTDGSITHNKAAIRNWKSLQKEYDESVQDNHFPKGTDARSLIYHEFGHRVWFCRGGGSAAKQVKKTLFTMGYGYVSPKQRDILIIELFSKYGAKYTNPSNTETIAEAFSEWYNSANPRSFCAMLMKQANMLP